MLTRLNRHIFAATSIACLAVTLPNPATGQPLVGPTARDLVEMRSIDGLTLSPDGRRIAFRVVRPSLASDTVTVQWYWTSTASGRAVALGRPSEPLRRPMFDMIENGRAGWTPDGKALLALELVGGAVAVHRLTPTIDRIIAGGPADIEDFEALSSPSRLVVRYRATRAAISKAQQAEESSGIHFDNSVSVEGLRLTRNFQTGSRWSTIRYDRESHASEESAGAVRTKTILLRDGVVAPAGDDHTNRTLLSGGDADEGALNLSSPDGTMAISVRTEKPARSLLAEPSLQVEAKKRDGTLVACPASFCLGPASAIRGVATIPASSEVVVLYERDFSARTGVFAWTPSTGATRVIRAADGSLDGGAAYASAPCVKAGIRLFCVSAGPDRPPHLVRIDLRDGRTDTLFDPNEALANRNFGSPRFIEWRDSAGNAANGILLLPPRRASPVPLVMTSYRCRGFLSGGFTSLAPEYLLAARGIASLCVNNNNEAGAGPGPDGKPVTLGPHLAAIDSYRAIISRLAQEGLIDPGRVGLAGHSFSSMVTAYAISHTNLFHAAVIGTGITIDPSALMFTEPLGAPTGQSLLDVLNVPHPIDDHDGRWAEISPALNAIGVSAPLLIQPPESEYDLALQLYAALNHAGKPVDMYIYPNEGHLVTRLPSHQLMRQARSVDWFDFWLNRNADVNTGVAGFDKEDAARLKSLAYLSGGG
jgi:dipeptidyl aminopeptidase/acylaminoacyl peptidase